MKMEYKDIWEAIKAAERNVNEETVAKLKKSMFKYQSF